MVVVKHRKHLVNNTMVRLPEADIDAEEGVDYGEDEAVDHVAYSGSHSLFVVRRASFGCRREVWFEHLFSFLCGQLAAMLVAAGVECASLLWANHVDEDFLVRLVFSRFDSVGKGSSETFWSGSHCREADVLK